MFPAKLWHRRAAFCLARDGKVLWLAKSAHLHQNLFVHIVEKNLILKPVNCRGNWQISAQQQLATTFRFPPAEFVSEADIIVFSEIGTGLDLNHFKQNFTGVCKPVDFALGDIDALILADSLHRFANCHFRRALNANPKRGG